MTLTRAIEPMEKDQVADKTVIVTGASQGIGAGVANRFLERGYNVVATSRRVTESAEIGTSDRLARVDGDIAEPETAKAVVETALARFGSVDALVNNAGIFFTKPFIDYTIEDYRRLAATNLEGFLHLTQRVVRQMLAQKRGGSIVSITTPMMDHPIAGVNASVVMLTKGGIEAMSKNIGMEYAKEQIRANTVAPGVVDTPLHKDNPKDFLKTLSPLQGVSTVEEIADAVLFLTEAPRITGEALHVDGGAHLGRW
jgi:NAD(P)-dependent dehydrogenase (short-subunit alcohol dehydrogenase family)